ncbi:MAG: hypothetical protein RIC55_16760 [Pirellulaceae bacterium]
MTRWRKEYAAMAAIAITFSCLVAGCSSGDSPEQNAAAQDRFFVAVSSGDTQRVLDLMHPELRKQIDEPLLADWMKQVNASLGKYEGMSWSDWNTKWEVKNGVKRNLAEGTFNFARGDAQAEFVFVDDQLVSFHVDSDKIPKDWFHGPSDAAIYQQRGAEFLRHLYTGEFDKIDQKVRDAFGTPVLENAAAEIKEQLGKVQKIEPDAQQWSDENGGRLSNCYRVEGDREVDGVHRFLYAQVDFGFSGLQGMPTGFKNGADAEIELPPEQAGQYEPREQAVLAAWQSSDAAKFATLMEPSLRDRLDDAVAAAWLKGVAANHGEFQALKSVARKSIYRDGRKLIESTLTCEHEQGDVDLRLEFKEVFPEHVTGFFIPVEHLKGWPEKLEVSGYQERGKAFLEKLLAGQLEESTTLMGPAFRAAAPVEKLAAIKQQIDEKLGTVETIEAGMPEVQDGETLQLVVPFQLKFEKGPTTGQVAFVYTGAAFVLNGFNVNFAD